MITTSQVEIEQWHDSEVRTRQINHHLPLLSADEVSEKAQQWHLNPEKAQAWTLGHPQLLSWLHALPEIGETKFLEKTAKYFLESLPEERRELASKISLFPVFNIAVLQVILPYSEEGNPEGFYARYLDAIRELGRAGLIFWDGENGAYRFTDSAVRKILARSFKARYPEEFLDIHNRVTTYYQSEARRVSYLQYSLVSVIYHLAQANSDLPPKERGEICIAWINENLPLWLGANWNAVLHTWETGAGDETVVDELHALIGKETFNIITDLLKRSKTKMEEITA